METHFQTSFIPKKPIETSADGPSLSQKAPLGILFIIGSIVLALSILSAVGVFAYTLILKSKLTNQVSQIEENRKSINEDEIKSISRLSDRIRIANTILDNHVAVSYIFDIIEASTLQNVAFTSFNYSYAGPDKINISMRGQAKTYASVVNQAEAFKNSPYTKDSFRNSIFSDVSKGGEGLIDFSFSTLLDVNAISFKKNVNRQNNFKSFTMSDGSGTSTKPAIKNATSSAATTSAPVSAPTQTQASTSKPTVPVAPKPPVTPPAAPSNPLNSQ